MLAKDLGEKEEVIAIQSYPIAKYGYSVKPLLATFVRPTAGLLHLAR